MEFANENVYHSQNRTNLKNKSPFDQSKKFNKKALADVGNVISFKSAQSVNIRSTHLNASNPIDQLKAPKSPNQQNKTVQKSKKQALLENMPEDFFTCSCSSHTHDDFSYELPPSLQLTKKEIDIFATQWSNPAPLKFSDDLNVSLEIVLVSDDFLSNDVSVSSSFMDVLNESFDCLSQLPEITC